MADQQTRLQIVTFHASDFDLATLAQTLTALKATATRTPTPVTVAQLEAIDASPTSILLLQTADTEGGPLVVGMVHVAIIYLEDKAHLGPICVEKESTPRGHGTPLMEAAIAHVKANFPSLRRLDLSNRPSHDLTDWYQKFGFIPRTEAAGDPSIVFRLALT